MVFGGFFAAGLKIVDANYARIQLHGALSYGVAVLSQISFGLSRASGAEWTDGFGHAYFAVRPFQRFSGSVRKFFDSGRRFRIRIAILQKIFQHERLRENKIGDNYNLISNGYPVVSRYPTDLLGVFIIAESQRLLPFSCHFFLQIASNDNPGG